MSTSFIAIKMAVRSAPPLTVLAIRFLVAGGLLAVFARRMGTPFPKGARAWIRLSVIGLLNMGLPAALNFIALRHASASMASIVTVLNPVLLALLAPRLLGEALTKRKLLGLAMGIAGVLVVMTSRVGHGSKPDTPLGVALMVLSALCMVGATLLFKRFPPREPLLMVNVAQQLASGLLVLPAIAVMEHPASIVLTPTLLGALAHLIFVISIGCGLLWFWLLRRGEAGAASSVLFLWPGGGVLVAAVVLHERLSTRDVLGLCAVTLGILLLRQSSSHGRRGTHASKGA
jgi:drug/metabolite transporter (DMT)-like permease